MGVYSRDIGCPQKYLIFWVPVHVEKILSIDSLKYEMSNKLEKVHMSAITGMYDPENQCGNFLASGVTWLLALVGSVSASKIFGLRS